MDNDQAGRLSGLRQRCVGYWVSYVPIQEKWLLAPVNKALQAIKIGENGLQKIGRTQYSAAS
jgi:hypothetical protein